MNIRDIFLNYFKERKSFLKNKKNNLLWIEHNNTNCFDEISVSLSIKKNKLIDIKYYGNACILTIGFAEYIVDFLLNKEINKVINELNEIKSSIQKGTIDKYNDYFIKLKQLNYYPNRTNCLSLSVESILNWCNKYKNQYND